MKNNGWKFRDFIKVEESSMNTYYPLAGSFAVIRCSGKFLLCYNIWRKQWEIPAGSREGNETPMDCAKRELFEETGQLVAELTFKGLLKSEHIETASVKYNPVYTSTIDRLMPFQENTETSQIILWDLQEEIGYIDEVDYRIISCID
ncbi:NUDIX hydrolase [Ornithinibacillus xuwenensis]|uniref:NUDIX hydrolase n=1 Tax=Ornithinibacillus xuwenensis TaxID=3144668 RepID=A0ABU9XHC6_9BACI